MTAKRDPAWLAAWAALGIEPARAEAWEALGLSPEILRLAGWEAACRGELPVAEVYNRLMPLVALAKHSKHSGDTL